MRIVLRVTEGITPSLIESFKLRYPCDACVETSPHYRNFHTELPYIPYAPQDAVWLWIKPDYLTHKAEYNVLLFSSYDTLKDHYTWRVRP